MRDATNNKSYVLVLKAFKEGRKHIGYILDNIIVFFYEQFYDTESCASLIQLPNPKSVYGKFFYPDADTSYV